MPSINLTPAFYEKVKKAADEQHRSVPKQLEYSFDTLNDIQAKKAAEQLIMEAYSESKVKYKETYEALSK